MKAIVLRSGLPCVPCFCSLKLFKWPQFLRQRSYESCVETAAARTFQKTSYLGVLLPCRPSDIILINSFQNVTAEAPVKDPGAISHKVFSQAVTPLRKQRVIFTDGQQLTTQESPICFHTTSVQLHASAQLLSTRPLPCEKLTFMNTHRHTFWVCFFFYFEWTCVMIQSHVLPLRLLWAGAVCAGEQFESLQIQKQGRVCIYLSSYKTSQQIPRRASQRRSWLRHQTNPEHTSYVKKGGQKAKGWKNIQ